VNCVLRTRVTPDVVRTDRGPEMTSRIMEEFWALTGTRHVLGAAFTPRHQGPGERARQIVMQNHLLLMNEVCHAFPQEWAALVPALEYLCETAPREPHGLSAFDVTQGFALLTDPQKRMAPSQIPWGQAETDVAAASFARFRSLFGVFSRVTVDEAQRKQEELNRKRSVAVFEAGEIVFRQLPAFARPAKHMLGGKVHRSVHRCRSAHPQQCGTAGPGDRRLG